MLMRSLVVCMCVVVVVALLAFNAKNTITGINVIQQLRQCVCLDVNCFWSGKIVYVLTSERGRKTHVGTYESDPHFEKWMNIHSSDKMSNSIGMLFNVCIFERFSVAFVGLARVLLVCTLSPIPSPYNNPLNLHWSVKKCYCWFIWSIKLQRHHMIYLFMSLHAPLMWFNARVRAQRKIFIEISHVISFTWWR